MQELQYATEDFHVQLHGLLHRQGVFQVMQSNLPSTPELFLEAQTALIHAHTAFAHAHQRLLEAHRATLQVETYMERVNAHRPPAVRIVPASPEIPSPPPLMRQAQLGVALTPTRPVARRHLFPPESSDSDLECTESVEDSQEDFDELQRRIDQERFQDPELVNAVDQTDFV